MNKGPPDMPIPSYDTSHPVLVTGATGYVASWLVKRLLEEGFSVHAAVRDPDNTAKVAHLQKLAVETPGTLKLFEADLLDQGSYSEAMQGCSVVFHTASPFTSHFTDAQKDLFDPAVIGTRNVLETANGVPSVTRIVVTSSTAAIYGETIDCSEAPGGILTEAQWNTSSSLTNGPYAYSKVEAEKTAWDIAKSQSQWRLVTINPALVLGPSLGPAPTSDSFHWMRLITGGEMKSGVPHLEIGGVDVRDVAEAHLRAGFLEDAEGRHILSNRGTSFLEMAQIIREHFGDSWQTPKRELPKFLVWLVGPLLDKSITRRIVSRSFNHPWRADNSKSMEALGIEYRPLEDAIVQMFQMMIDTRAVKTT